MRRLRRIKILATLGPASSDSASIRKLFEAGADVFRINMSHTPHDKMRELVATFSEQSADFLSSNSTYPLALNNYASMLMTIGNLTEAQPLFEHEQLDPVRVHAGKAALKSACRRCTSRPVHLSAVLLHQNTSASMKVQHVAVEEQRKRWAALREEWKTMRNDPLWTYPHDGVFKIAHQCHPSWRCG